LKLHSTPPLSEQALTQAMILAITCAKKLSGRAGVGWAMLDAQGRHLHSEGIIAGTNSLRLAASIIRYANRLHTLVITLPPSNLLFDQPSLRQALDYSKCQYIVTDSAYETMVETAEWHDWLKSCHKQLHLLPSNRCAQNVSSGPKTVLTHLRPWVTSISAADMSGRAVPLRQLTDEFGFQAHLGILARQSRAIFYSRLQSEFIKTLPRENLSNEPQEFFEIENCETAEVIFRFCAAERRCSVLVFTDLSLQSQLMSRNLTDEVIHHVSLTPNQGTWAEPEMTSLPTEDWQLSESSIIGNCSRLQLTRAQSVISQPLGQRLN
jgi:hypothetical protein